MNLTKEQLKLLVNKKPAEVSEQQIIESLIKKGHTFDGIEKVPMSVRASLEPKQITQNPIAKVGEFVGEASGFTGTTKAAAGAIGGGMVANKANNLSLDANKLVDEAKRLPQGDPRRRELLLRAQQMSSNASTGASKFLNEAPTVQQAAGSMGKLALTAATAGVGAPATVGGRIGVGAAYGAGFGGSSAMEQGKGGKDILKEAAIGGAIGGAIPAAIEGVKFAVKGVPKLLAYTSNTPDEVLQRQYDNPELSSKILKGVKGEGTTGVTDDINSAAKKLRGDLSKQWEEGSKSLIDKNTGARIGFTSKETKFLQRVADDYGIDLPQNLSNVSLKESLELNKGLNELYNQKAVREGAEGIIVRKTKEMVGSKFSKFQGVDDFLKNYGDEKKVLDAIVDIMKPWSDKPVTKNTALSRVKSIFNDNKPAFLSAIKDLEQSTGIPFLTDKAAALNILQKSPVTGKGLPSQLVELLAFPITSPRLAGLQSRVAGRVGRSGANQALRNVASEGVRRTVR